ncbi:hypothetical protein [Paracidovorax konjaci]|uniref:hypothetical protein n=1 Tax=Paracidovorax konjaci TaxID=32040 RepID=UPI0011138843|nr:hypothetical protein [Paracidovorax konjaci]
MKSSARTLALAAVAGVLTAASGQGRESESQQAFRYAPEKIQRILIERPAARARFDQGVQCRSLKLDEKRVRFFLRHGTPTTSAEYRRNAIVDDCSADAKVFFSDGTTATVSIDSGTGWGALSVGKRSSFLACDSCVDILEPGFSFDPRRRPSDLPP